MFGKAEFPDGTRVLDPITDKLWLVFDGRYHHVTCGDVFSKLFRERVPITPLNGHDRNSLKHGDDLIFGSCIVRGDTNVTTYFLAVHPTKVKLHPIPSVEVFDKYGFDWSQCRQLPENMLKRFPKGRPLV